MGIAHETRLPGGRKDIMLALAQSSYLASRINSGGGEVELTDYPGLSDEEGLCALIAATILVLADKAGPGNFLTTLHDAHRGNEVRVIHGAKDWTLHLPAEATPEVLKAVRTWRDTAPEAARLRPAPAEERKEDTGDTSNAQQPPAEPGVRYEVDDLLVQAIRASSDAESILRVKDLTSDAPQLLPTKIAARMLALAEREGCELRYVTFNISFGGSVVLSAGNSQVELKKPKVSMCEAIAVAEALGRWKGARPITLQQEDIGKMVGEVMDAIQAKMEKTDLRMIGSTDPNAAMIARDGAPRAKPASTTAPTQAQPQRRTLIGWDSVAPIGKTGMPFGLGALED